MNAKFGLAEKTEYQILLHRHLIRNEKARLRMARKRAELKLEMSGAAREAAADITRLTTQHPPGTARSYVCQPTTADSSTNYKEAFGEEALAAYVRKQQLRRRNARRKRFAKEPYHSDGCQEEDDPELVDELSDDGSWGGVGLREASLG
ncbi:hypothetical protein R3P38DRAFT_3206306 [Favolaschia claudopus]|uniref:Uncharacterized protein n=1 Tax=Favolaschia claudopus TaxID=2862362 RepID=A0AAW0AKY2_9AGAR